MPKLAVVVCAATFLTLTMAATLRTVDSSTFHLDINEAVGKIRQCDQSLQQAMHNLGPQSLNMHSEILDEYKANITKTIEKTRTAVNDTFKNVRPDSHTNKCRTFLTDVETIGKELAENSLTTKLMDFMELIDSIREVHILSSQKQEQLQAAQFNPCAQSNCNTVEQSINNFVSQFCSHAKEVTDEYKAMLNGTRTRNMLFSIYTTFVSEGREVVEKTRSCLSLSGGSGQNEYVVSKA